MGLVPLDLQILYSQLDNVSKTVAHQQQGKRLATAVEQERIAQKDAEKNEAVQQLKSNDEAIQRIKDREGENKNFQEEKRKQETPEENQKPEEPVAFQDPHLGKFIDISG